MNDGSGIYFDGMTSARRNVSIDLGDELLSMRDGDGVIVADWPYEEMQQLPAPKEMMRLGLRNQPLLARLEIRDPVLADAIDQRSLSVDQTWAADRRSHSRAALWTVVATVSLVLVATLVVPALAARLAPILPVSLEQRLGTAVDAQMRAMLDTKRLGDRLTCGHDAEERPGQAALDALTSRLSRAAALPVVPKVSVLRRADANAITLPGGHIYVYQGLLAKTENPDQLAGAIAHEMGHVAHRDGTRAILQTAGLSLLFGTLLGDFVGGTAVVTAAKSMIQLSYSRRVETAADTFGVGVMQRAGGDARALGVLLTRLQGDQRPRMRLWLDHPQVQDRVRNIDALAPAAAATAPLLDADQWAALQHICKDF